MEWYMYELHVVLGSVSLLPAIRSD